RFPEAVDRFDVTPEAALLPRCEVQAGRRRLDWCAFSGRRLVCRAFVWRIGSFLGGVGEGLWFGERRRLPLLRLADRLLAEQDRRLTEKLRFHIREDAVEVERDAQGHGDFRVSQVGPV